MNSYPHEFLAHHLPLMFVAGLATETQPPAASSSRRPSVQEASNEDPPRKASLSALDVGVAEESADAASPATAAVDVPKVVEPEPEVEAAPEDPFRTLHLQLRKLFEKQGEKGKMWMKEDDKQLFRVMCVDKNIRLPPRKVPPPSTTPASPQQPPHSALSPLSPHSPVYPDGLIAPMWVRKHSEIVPAVFVLFLALPDFTSWTSANDSSSGTTTRQRASSTASNRSATSASGKASAPPSPSRPVGSGSAAVVMNAAEEEKKRKELQGQADEELIKEIADRRKKTADRGIKLTVVLLAGRDMLDDPALDTRLSYIRRQSGLDSRASLFVLTPVGNDELAEFAASLQESLYDPALDFYSGHYKRNRRKRSRLPANPAIPPYTTVPPANGVKLLSAQGWAVRYDYKAGVFAEVRGEIDVARKHLEDSWHELAGLFASTMALPPRTKRWAEAKVLADCIAVKVCRLYLYEGDTESASGFFHQHLSRFSELSRGWGIGEETFEYWSWMARQYRIYAELLEMAISAGIRVNLPLPVFMIPQPGAMTPALERPDANLVTSAVNAVEVLQHPGYYWYMAGSCNVERRDRFKAAVQAEIEKGQPSTAPGFANEQKADHSAIIVELFTKAYALFKGQRSSQTRMSLFIAYRIAETYAQSGQHEMAMKFFERIAKTYRREQWQAITWALQALWLDCAQNTGAVDTVAQLLWGMIAPGGTSLEFSERAYDEELLSLVTTSIPSSTDPIEVVIGGQSDLFTTNSAFWQQQAIVGEQVPWQVQVKASLLSRFSNLQFDSLILGFSDGRDNVVFSHKDDSTSSTSVFSAETPEVDLVWSPGTKKVFTGKATMEASGKLAVSSCVLVFKKGSWTFHLKSESLPTVSSAGEVWSHPSAVFLDPPRSISIEPTWSPEAYCGETGIHGFRITNNDKSPLKAVLKVEVQEVTKLRSLVEVKDEASSSGELEVELDELAPGVSVDIPLHLTSPTEGLKTIRCTLADAERATGTEQRQYIWRDASTVNVTNPFTVHHDVDYRHPQSSAGTAEPLDLGEIYWETFITTMVQLVGKRKVDVKGWKYIDSAQTDKRLSYSSLATDITEESAMEEGDTHSIVHMYEIALPEAEANYHAGAPIPTGVINIDWKLSSSMDPKIFTTSLALPALVLPTTTDEISATLLTPSTVQLSRTFSTILKVFNASPMFPASGLSLQIEASDAFVWKGARHTKLPLLLPRSEWEIELTLIPVGLTGHQMLPKMHLVTSGEAEGQREIMIRTEGGRVNANSDGIETYVQP